MAWRGRHETRHPMATIHAPHQGRPKTSLRAHGRSSVENSLVRPLPRIRLHGGPVCPPPRPAPEYRVGREGPAQTGHIPPMSPGENRPSMFELMQRQEPLHEDLVPHLCDLPRLGWRGLKHPLVFQIPYTPEYNAMANEQYRRKKEALAEAEAEGAWGTFVYLHERPYRWPALRDIAKRVPTAKYWPIVGDIWTDSENIFEEAAMVRACLEGYGHDLALRPSMMSEKERLALAGM